MVRPSQTTLRALRAALLVMVVAVLGSACRADVTVDVQVEEDGSGLVRAELVLDAAATDGLRDLGLDATLPLTDLAQAGWEIERPDTSADGGTVIEASKAFGEPTQLGEVMNDLSGPNGVFQDFRLARVQSFGRVEYSMSGIIDPTGGFDAFGDEDLVTRLGRSLSSVAVSPPYEASPEDVGFTLTASVPGEFQDGGSTGSIVATETGAQGTWATDLAGRRVDVALQSARRSTSAQVLRGVAVVAAVLAALVLFAQILRVFGARRRALQEEERARARREAARRSAVGASVGGEGSGDGGGSIGVGGSGSSGLLGLDREEAGSGVGSDDTAAESEAGERYRVVALDGPGVLYKEGDDIRQLLVPFARERGAGASPDDIADKARLLSLGRLTPADFWRVIGVEGDPNELDAAYLATHQLNSGVVRYLRLLRDREIRAACITNDSAAWAMKLRSSHSLDGLVDPWVVSGSVGVRKPDAPLFEVLRRVTGEPRSAILVVDDDLDNLDAAKELGFPTRWFTREGEADQARGHDIMRGFEGAVGVDAAEGVDGDEPAPPD